MSDTLYSFSELYMTILTVNKSDCFCHSEVLLLTAKIWKSLQDLGEISAKILQG